MSKNKNKNRNNQQQNQVNKQPVSKPSLTDEQKVEIELKDDETKGLVIAEGIEVPANLSNESGNKLADAESKEDITKYWNYVKEINKRFEALINKAEDEKNKTTKIREELEGSKKETETIKLDLRKKLEEFNKKDKEITEREFAIDNGEYTGVIKRLLDSLKETEKKVFTDTEDLLKELSEFHKKNLEEFIQQQKENIDIKKQSSELKREKKKFEVDKKIFEEELKDEYETKYSEELKIKTAELERLQRKYIQLEENSNKLKQFFDDLQNAFESTEPQEILMHQRFLTQELSNLKKELEERPEKHEIESKQAQIEELLSKVNEYKEKVNEGELLELKRILTNMDSYVIEINGFKNLIESAKVREASLRKIIEDKTQTIDQLKGESTKKADAFEFSKKCDSDTATLGFNHIEKNKDLPNSLLDLVAYLQNWMAFKSDKPFYYSPETIRIFLAGLNMSPISILQGISGTGKTSLPREFAKAMLTDSNYLGIDVHNQNNAAYRICAIQSGWRDNMDLMGYYNSFEHKYKETDFFKALYLANLPKYSDTLFLIILDEMNLSRPEHYFADFLSLLEQSPNERYINLSNTPDEVLPAQIKGGKLRIPENVRFIGTANHDETTLEFAPKTYDRSNLMEMPKNHPGKVGLKSPEKAFNVKYSWLNSKFIEAEKKHKEYSKRFHDFINSDEMKLLLIDKGIGVGNRLEFQAEKFITVFIDSGNKPEIDLAIATDHLISSRLFRSLKNRYDLDRANLSKFKEDYVKIFNHAFKQKPSFAIELLETEIGKK